MIVDRYVLVTVESALGSAVDYVLVVDLQAASYPKAVARCESVAVAASIRDALNAL